MDAYDGMKREPFGGFYDRTNWVFSSWTRPRIHVLAASAEHADHWASEARLLRDEWRYVQNHTSLAGLDRPMVYIYETFDRVPHYRWREIMDYLRSRRAIRVLDNGELIPF